MVEQCTLPTSIVSFICALKTRDVTLTRPVYQFSYSLITTQNGLDNNSVYIHIYDKWTL